MGKEVLEFISKIYVGGKSSHPVIRVLAKISLVIIFLIFLFEIWIGEFSFDSIKNSFLPLILLLYVMSTTKPVAGYKSTVAKVELDDEEIIIYYEGLDRDDKMGPRIERTTVPYNNITKIEYSRPLQCLNIQGFPIESIQYLKQPSKKEFIKDYYDKKEEKRTVLYVSGEDREKLVKILEERTGKEVSQLD